MYQVGSTNALGVCVPKADRTKSSEPLAWPIQNDVMSCASSSFSGTPS